MGPRVKMVLGALLVLLGAAWYVPGGPFNSSLASFSSLTNLQSLAVSFQGGLGVFLLLIGAFVVWIERDELRIRREMESRAGDRVRESMETVAENGGEASYVCEECGEEFDTERGLKVHQGQKH